jgi:hypothetical protein
MAERGRTKQAAKEEEERRTGIHFQGKQWLNWSLWYIVAMIFSATALRRCWDGMVLDRVFFRNNFDEVWLV